ANVNDAIVQVRIATSTTGNTLSADNPGEGNVVRKVFRNFRTHPDVDFDGATGDIIFNLGDILIPNRTSGEPVRVRVGYRNSSDNPGPNPNVVEPENNNYIFSPEFAISNPIGRNVVSSRFINTGGAGQRRSGGAGLPGSTTGTGGRFGGVRRSPGSILRPR
ncbi:MAG TPA: hypothetical protein VF719_01465, partial [Abditibacteriaceae bacterium]